MEVRERWRQPVIPVAVDEDPTRVWVVGGEPRRACDITYTPEQINRIRAGYVCIYCQEPHEQPFPVECSLCRFPMRARQLERFQHEFDGETWIGPRESLADEITRLDEEAARARFSPGSRIWVPGR